MTAKSPLSNLPGWDIAERMDAEDEMRKAFKLLPQSRRFAEPRELGKPLVDPDAEQLVRTG